MRILMLVNWKVEYCREAPPDKQPPDYYVEGQPYWFFRYFKKPVEVDVVDVRSFPWLEHFEKERLRFYVVQALRALPRLRKYDLILSHGMQSGVALSLFRRIFPTKAKHIVFDIGAFNSAAEEGGALKLMQFASRSIDGIIYHTSRQKEYYKRCFPWVLDKSAFIKFGTDAELFCQELQEAAMMSDSLVGKLSVSDCPTGKAGLPDRLSGQAELSFVQNRGGADGEKKAPYILCVGYAKRDWDTLYNAYEILRKKGGHRVSLRLVGHPHFHPENPQVESLPVLPLPQLMEEIRGALFCVLPLESFLYSFGQMTLLQQMALGKAVIAARVPSMTDYVIDGEDALLYEPGDAEDLCRRMETLLEDGQRREKIARQAAASVRHHWNEKHMAEEIEKFIEEYMRK